MMKIAYILSPEQSLRDLLFPSYRGYLNPDIVKKNYRYEKKFLWFFTVNNSKNSIYFTKKYFCTREDELLIY